MLGLYVHIPFCRTICSYCDFLKKVPVKNEIKDYLKALEKELLQYEEKMNKIDTIYIGGGTPTMLSAEELDQLLSLLSNINPKEYTIEMNPENYTHEKGLLLKKYGITRVSLGVQTFNAKHLKTLNRNHNINEVLLAYNDLINIGINNINIDMIFSIPGQTVDELKDDINILLKINPNHVSYYSLILEDKTYLYHQFIYNNLKMNDEELEADMYELIINRLSKDYHHYEISNFAKPGFESMHNLLYWSMDEYIGLGLGACGFIDNKRTTNTRILNKYLDSPETIYETQTKPELIQDEMIFGLRKLDGIDIAKINKKYGINVFKNYDIETMIKDGLLEYNNDILKLTTKGLFLANQVFMIFI